MVQPTFPKGFQRLRSYGVHATRTFAKITPVMHEALTKVKGIVKGAIQIIAPLTLPPALSPEPWASPLALSVLSQ
jgi:hypothetical protein